MMVAVNDNLKSSQGPAAQADPEALVAAVDKAREQMAPLDEDIRKRSDAVVKAREAFIAAGVREMVRKLKTDERSKAVLFELVDDPLVYAVLMELGIVKPDVMTRVARAMERIKPYVSSHGGRIELVGIEENVAYVRMHGSCAGCSMSSATLHDGVEEVVKAAVPEIERVEQVNDGPVAGVVQLTVGASSETSQPGTHGWIEGPPVEEITDDACVRVQTEACDAIVLRRDGKLFAYRNACPHQGLPLHDGTCAGDHLTCPWHGMMFDVQSGECLNEPQVQLDPYPLRVEDGIVWIRPTGTQQ